MTSTFSQAFQYLIGSEGTKYTNDPDDRGGPTKFGITKSTYENFFKYQASDSEIENMPIDVAKQIYQAEYWGPMRLDEVADLAVATALFDCGVLYSPNASVRMAQKALCGCGRELAADGVMGSTTLGYLNDISAFLFLNVFRVQVLKRIEAVIEANPADEKFRTGWTNRANRLTALEFKF